MYLVLIVGRGSNFVFSKMSILVLGPKSVFYTNDTEEFSHAGVAAEVWSWQLTESTAEFNSEES